MFERVIKLIGEDNLKKIQSQKVMVVGLGGVGGYAVESLIRSGIENIVVVDYDTIDISNLNRQIITNRSNIGTLKVEEATKRILSINPNVVVEQVKTKLDENNINKSVEKSIKSKETKAVKEEKTEQSKKEKPTGKVRSWTKLPTHRKSHIHSMYVPVINALRLQSPTRYGRPMTARVRTTISSIRNSASKTANSTADLRTWE